MANIKPIYLIGAAAVALYFFKDKLFGKKEDDTTSDNLPASEARTNDVVIDTTKTGQSVEQAIETAKKIGQGIKDFSALIKTPGSSKNILFTKGKKKRSKHRRKKKKAKIFIGPTESSFKPFAPMESSYKPYEPLSSLYAK